MLGYIAQQDITHCLNLGNAHHLNDMTSTDVKTCCYLFLFLIGSVFNETFSQLELAVLLI